MSLDEQKNKFLATVKGQRAVAYANKWFNDFNSSKLSSLFLLNFYYDTIIYRQDEFDEYIEQSYEALFWFWFKERYQRIMNEQKLAQANIEYEKLMKEIDEGNIFNVLGKFFTGAFTYAPYIILGGLVIYGIKVFKK